MAPADSQAGREEPPALFRPRLGQLYGAPGGREREVCMTRVILIHYPDRRESEEANVLAIGQGIAQLLHEVSLRVESPERTLLEGARE